MADFSHNVSAQSAPTWRKLEPLHGNSDPISYNANNSVANRLNIMGTCDWNMTANGNGAGSEHSNRSRRDCQRE